MKRESILIEIGHPAHVHFFSSVIANLEKGGHRVIVTTRNKDITNALLDRKHIPYRCLSAPAKKRWALPMELLGRWSQMSRLIRGEKVALVASISGISTSLPAKLSGVRNVVFTDTEDAKVSNGIAFHFADAIYTPEFFLKDLGEKHRRYRGLHELLYLQDLDLEQAAKQRAALALPKEYVILRLVANDALHDWNIRGLTEENVSALVETLTPLGKVFITSEHALPSNLDRFRMSFPIEHIHAVLAGAKLFVGESPTMAVESSLLGTPAFLISERAKALGNMIRLERDHDLLRNLDSWSQFAESLRAIPDFEAFRRGWSQRAKRFRDEMPKMDRYVTGVLLEELERCAA